MARALEVPVSPGCHESFRTLLVAPHSGDPAAERGQRVSLRCHVRTVRLALRGATHRQCHDPLAGLRARGRLQLSQLGHERVISVQRIPGTLRRVIVGVIRDEGLQRIT